MRGRALGSAQRVPPARDTQAGASQIREVVPEGGDRGEWVTPFSFSGILKEMIPGASAPCPGQNKPKVNVRPIPSQSHSLPMDAQKLSKQRHLLA